MSKIATFVMSGALFAGAALAVSTVATAADKPAAAPAAAPVAAPAAAPAAKGPAAAPAAAPAAKPAGPPPPATPAPEVESLFKGYAGSWKCDSTMPAGAVGPGSPEAKGKSEVKIVKDLGGFWYKGDFKMKKTKTMPGFEAAFLLGWDPMAKTAVNVSYDSQGGFTIEHGPGATPESITFTGDGQMMGMKTKIRETMTKKSDKNVVHTFELDMGKGFQLVDTDDCKK
jgi:hypothetical protein